MKAFEVEAVETAGLASFVVFVHPRLICLFEMIEVVEHCHTIFKKTKSFERVCKKLWQKFLESFVKALKVGFSSLEILVEKLIFLTNCRSLF